MPCWFQKKWSIGLFSVGCLSVLTACGSGLTGSVSSGASSTAQVSSIDQLPQATSPVVSTSSSDLSAKSLHLGKATTGINLGTMSAASFTTNSSIAACEMSNRFRAALHAAAKGDRIQCYVGEVIKQNIAAGHIVSTNLYDGNYHLVDLTSSDSSGAGNGTPSRVKMKIVQNAAGSITEFEMFACQATTQTEYLHQLISTDNTFAMTSKEVEDSSSETGASVVTVSGSLNASGQFVDSKTIAAKFSYVSGTFTNHGEGTATQSATRIAYSGYEQGSFTNTDASTGTFTDRIYSEAELLDGNTAGTSDYNLQLLAVGDGAAHAIMSGAQTGSTADNTFSWSDDSSQGWNGDTTLVDATAAGTFLTNVQAVTPPAAASSVSVSFDASETYNCSGTADTTATIDEAALMASSCSELELESSWVNCWDIIAQDDQTQ